MQTELQEIFHVHFDKNNMLPNLLITVILLLQTKAKKSPITLYKTTVKQETLQSLKVPMK